MIKFRWVSNVWGWSPRGIAQWVRTGWGLFPVWTVEHGADDGRDLKCCKLGPIAWNWPVS